MEREVFAEVTNPSYRVGSARRFQPLIEMAVLCVMGVFGLGAYVADALSPGKIPVPTQAMKEYILISALKDIKLPAPAPTPGTPKLEHNGGPTTPLIPPDKIEPEVLRTTTADPNLPPGDVPGGNTDLPEEVIHGDILHGLPPPPEQPKPEPVIVGGNIKPPAKLVDVKPIYPAIAQAAHVQGMVIIKATIGEDGRVIDASILRSIPLLDGAALDAVRRWQFSPTLLNGKPQAVIMTVTVNFALQ